MSQNGYQSGYDSEMELQERDAEYEEYLEHEIKYLCDNYYYRESIICEGYQVHFTRKGDTFVYKMLRVCDNDFNEDWEDADESDYNKKSINGSFTLYSKNGTKKTFANDKGYFTVREALDCFVEFEELVNDNHRSHMELYKITKHKDGFKIEYIFD